MHLTVCSYHVTYVINLKLRYLNGKTNDAYITTASLIVPSHWNAIIAAVKFLIKHGGIENVEIPSLLLRLGRSLEGFASPKRTLGIKTKNDDIVNDVRKFWSSMLKNVANIGNMHWPQFMLKMNENQSYFH